MYVDESGKAHSQKIPSGNGEKISLSRNAIWLSEGEKHNQSHVAN